MIVIRWISIILAITLIGICGIAYSQEFTDDYVIDRLIVELDNPMKGSKIVKQLKDINTQRSLEALLHIAQGNVPGLMRGVDVAAAQAFEESLPDKRDAWILATSKNWEVRQTQLYSRIVKDGIAIDDSNWDLILSLTDFNDPLSPNKTSVFERIKRGLSEEECKRLTDFTLLLYRDYSNKKTAEKIDIMIGIVAAYEEAEWTRQVRPKAPYSILAGAYIQLKLALVSLADPNADNLLREELEKANSPIRNVILAALTYRGDLSAKSECLEVAQSTEDDLMRYIAFDGYCSVATPEEVEEIAPLAEEKPYLVTYKLPEVSERNLLYYSLAIARQRIKKNKPTWVEMQMRVKTNQKQKNEALGSTRGQYKPFVLNREAIKAERQADVAAGKKAFQLRPLPAAQAGNVRRMLHEVSNFKDVYGKKPIEERRVGGAERSQGESMKTMLRGMISQFPDTEEAGEARKHLFDIHILHEDLTEARAECETASREAPGTEAESLLWLRLGEALKNRQDYANAVMAFAHVLDPVQKGRGYLRPMEAEFAGKFQMPVRIEKENYVQARIGWIECLYRLGRKEPADAKRADLIARYPEFKGRIDSTLDKLLD